ncbi:hypothetical protein CYMTET_34725 [Cymbomonas tetramitiformis]|uniref:TIR domain-containing protein n=1 Tax=Cymbomonas tetramitiformis TaxID=36881 RepID=A0AAE0FAK8_9CHLO|nr:hypothetical protein CYMTET_34725 [Cymbomonas tetramitiformis]
MEDKIYDVFLSYHSGSIAEKNLAHELYNKLTSEYSLRVFKDSNSLPKGEVWKPKLTKAVWNSKVFVPIVSSHTYQSMEKVTTESKDYCLFDLEVAEKDIQRQYLNKVATKTKETLVKLSGEHLENHALSNATMNRSVRQVMKEIAEFQGHFLSGKTDDATSLAANNIKTSLEASQRPGRQKMMMRTNTAKRLAAKQGLDQSDFALSDRINVSLNFFADGPNDNSRMLTFRTVLETSLKQLFPDSETLVQNTLKAAEHADPKMPFVFFENSNDQVAVNKALLNRLSSEFAGSFWLQSVGERVKVHEFAFGLTHEYVPDDMRGSVEDKLRLMVATLPFLEVVRQMSEEGQVPSVEAPSHALRWECMKQMAELVDQERTGNRKRKHSETEDTHPSPTAKAPKLGRVKFSFPCRS